MRMQRQKVEDRGSKKFREGGGRHIDSSGVTNEMEISDSSDDKKEVAI